MTNSPGIPSYIESAAGVRLVTGLVAPFLTPAGQREVEGRWGASAETLFKESTDLAAKFAERGAVHAALGVWFRNHQIPDAAAALLGDLTGALPVGDEAAQRMLDAWANDHTNGMIPTFPCGVQPDTVGVLASAIAVEDKWTRSAKEGWLAFGDKRVEGFRSNLPEVQIASDQDHRSVRATLMLTSGLEMRFAISADGVEAARDLLGQSNVFGHEVTGDQPFVENIPVSQDSTNVLVDIPVYTTRSSHDLMRDAHKWGLAKAFEPEGVPGLNHLEVSDARQDAFIEVTHTGVRAAAVTAMMVMRAASFAPSPKLFRQRLVTFSQPFAYEIRLPDYQTPLFTGVYSG